MSPLRALGRSLAAGDTINVVVRVVVAVVIPFGWLILFARPGWLAGAIRRLRAVFSS